MKPTREEFIAASLRVFPRTSPEVIGNTYDIIASSPGAEEVLTWLMADVIKEVQQVATP